MSKRDRNGDIARGLIIGFLVAALLFVALGVLPITVNVVSEAATDCGAATNDCANYSEGVPDRWYWFRRLFAMEDTLAQWIMMIFAIIAAFVLIWTLITTRRMAKDTRDIGQAQARAYLTLEDIHLNAGLDPDGRVTLDLSGKVINSGQTPASGVETRFVFLCHSGGQIATKVAISDFESTGEYGTYIPSKGWCGTHIRSTIPATKDDLASGQIRVSVIYFFDYTDVFKRRMSSIPITAELKNIFGPSAFEFAYIRGKYDKGSKS